MAIAKVIYKANASATPEVWMDATPATATAADILAPKTAMLADGVLTTGTGTGGGVPNLTDKTVTPSTETQIVTADTDTGSVALKTSSTISSRISGAVHTSGFEFSPSYTLTDDAFYRLIGGINVLDSNGSILESYYVDSIFAWVTEYSDLLLNSNDSYIRKMQIKKDTSTYGFMLFEFGQTATFGWIGNNLRLYEVNTSYDGLDIVTVNPISLAPAKSASPNANYDVPILPGTETLAQELFNISDKASAVSTTQSISFNSQSSGFTLGDTYFVTGEVKVFDYDTREHIETISLHGYWDCTTSYLDLPATITPDDQTIIAVDRIRGRLSSSIFYMEINYTKPGRVSFTQPIRFYSVANAYVGLPYTVVNKPTLVNKTITGSTGNTQFVFPNTETLVWSKTITNDITHTGTGSETKVILDSGVLTSGQTYRIAFIAEYYLDGVDIGSITVNCDIVYGTNQYFTLVKNPDDGSILVASMYLHASNRLMYVGFFGESTSSHRLTFLTPVNFYTMSGNNVGLSSVCVLPAQVPYSETLMKNYISRSDYFTDIEWPEGLTNIGYGAFASCTGFNPSSLPSGITNISQYAFYCCYELALTSLPSGITSIGQYAFYYCYKLALTSLPSGVTSIQPYAFYNCYELALTSLPSGVTAINSNGFSSCYNLALTSLPSGVTYIESYAFRNCEGITTISCDGAITTLGSNVFNGSSSHPMQLASASFPNMAISSLSTVFGTSTAANACQELTFVDIGSTIGIAANAFANCYKLQTLVLRKTSSVCSLANVSAFLNTPLRGYNSLTGTVYVPNDLISSYQSATNWSTLYNDGTITFKKIEGSDYDLS